LFDDNKIPSIFVSFKTPFHSHVLLASQVFIKPLKIFWNWRRRFYRTWESTDAFYIYLLTYLLTPWSKVLLKKL